MTMSNALKKMATIGKVKHIRMNYHSTLQVTLGNYKMNVSINSYKEVESVCCIHKNDKDDLMSDYHAGQYMSNVSQGIRFLKDALSD